MAEERSTLAKTYRATRWIILLALVAIVALMLKRPAPAAAKLTPQERATKSSEFEASLEQLENAPEHTEARFDSDQVNAFIATAAAKAQAQPAPTTQTTAAATT